MIFIHFIVKNDQLIFVARIEDDRLIFFVKTEDDLVTFVVKTEDDQQIFVAKTEDARLIFFYWNFNDYVSSFCLILGFFPWSYENDLSF